MVNLLVHFVRTVTKNDRAPALLPLLDVIINFEEIASKLHRNCTSYRSGKVEKIRHSI